MRLRQLASLTLGATAIFLAARPAVAQGFRHGASRDGADVWAVGAAGNVYRSLDGGAVWSARTLGGAEFRGVAAYGDQVWMVDAAGNLWRSTNSGETFTSQQPAGGTPLYGVFFTDAGQGWIAGASGNMMRTTDGGASWAVVTTSTTAALNAVRVAGGEGWACGAAGTLLHSTDGGSTWTASQPFAVSRDLRDVVFSGTDVFVAGADAFFASSTDGGGNWVIHDLKIASRADVNGMALLADGTLWLCGGGGFLRRTANGGRTWTYARHPIVTGLAAVHFTDPQHGWAFAARSKNVARTSDGGATWTVPGGAAFTYSWTQKLSSGAASIRGNTLAIDPFNKKKLYCVQGRTVFASWNLGDTWTSIATIAGAGTRTNAFLVAPDDSLTWLAIVQDGDRVARTTDGGATWTAALSIAFTEYGLPLEQDPTDRKIVYFGPEDGKIWRSTDFGATWAELSNPGFRSPDDIVAVPDTSVLYVSDGVTGSGQAQVWRSSNGGVTWTLKRTMVSSEIPTIGSSWLEPTLAYSTCWSSGGVQRTIDMGETWPDIAPTPSAWGADVAKDDPWVAMYSVYSGSRSYLTTDKGATFQQAVLSGSNYAVLVYDRGTYLAHQSSGVYKATINQPDMPVNNVQTVTLLAPNGGESWAFGESQSIGWNSQNLALVRLEYQSVPAGAWTTITPSAAGPAGTYVWVVPNDPTATARMRASDANDSNPLDESNTDFAIVVPAISATPEVLDFGGVVIGSNTISTLRVNNPGTAPLVVSGITVEGGGPFTPVATSLVLPPGGADSVVVVFEPVGVQTYQDALLLVHNGPGSPLRERLVGVGLQPVDVSPAERPTVFQLQDSSPNPFGQRGTVIAYALPRACNVRLVIYNALGQQIARLVDGRQDAGRYALRFPPAAQTQAGGVGSSLPSGVYFYKLQAGTFVATKQMVYVR